MPNMPLRIDHLWLLSYTFHITAMVHAMSNEVAILAVTVIALVEKWLFQIIAVRIENPRVR